MTLSIHFNVDFYLTEYSILKFPFFIRTLSNVLILNVESQFLISIIRSLILDLEAI